MNLDELRSLVLKYTSKDNGLEQLLRDFEGACLRYLAVRTDHIYKKYSNKPIELINETDKNRTSAHDNLIACYHALFRNMNKYAASILPVLEGRKNVGAFGLEIGFALLKKL